MRIAAALLVLSGILAGTGDAGAQTVLRIFSGQALPAEMLRPVLEGYMAAHPSVRVEIESGGATPEERQAYLNRVLATRDPGPDLFLLDMLRPAQFAAAQWVEPLDSHLGAERDSVLAGYFPVWREAGIVGGKLVALPMLADAQFLYYRSDLLQKYGLAPPTSWDALKAAARVVLAGENNPALRGFETVGAPVESAVCSYLAPLWSLGEELLKEGRLALPGEAARRPFDLWLDLKAAGIAPANLAEIHTDRVRLNMQAGELIFAIGWGYARARFEEDAESTMHGRVGIAPLPGAGCAGGWLVAVSAFSRQKPEAVRLARYLAGPAAGRQFAREAGLMPVFPALYGEVDLLGARPWLAAVLPVIGSARARPATPRYGEVSEIIRGNLHAVLAGGKTVEAALADMTTRLGMIFR
ncbi:MAG: extracellular solute-binding protein [Hyphomicrobiales bacterium]|nr:extracellular solute-binding protein [Hyphomicrobiales bacterium]